MKKPETGTLYKDSIVRLERYADGSIHFYCRCPVQIWNTERSGRHDFCVITNFLRERDDGSIDEVRRDKDPFKRKRK
jgi:hypothetical protein